MESLLKLNAEIKLVCFMLRHLKLGACLKVSILLYCFILVRERLSVLSRCKVTHNLTTTNGKKH